MATTRRRSTRGRSSVFNPGPQRYSQRAASAASSVGSAMSPTVSRPSALGPNVQSALAPRVEAFAPDFPVFDELPPVDVEPDQGYVPPQEEGGSSLVDAIMQDEEQPLAAAPDMPSAPYSGQPGDLGVGLFEPGGAFAPPPPAPPPAPSAGDLGVGLFEPGGQFGPPPPRTQLADALTDLQKRRLR